MTDEQALIAAYAEAPNDLDRRLVLADFFDERGDPRGAWLRDPELAAYMPRAEHPGRALAEALAEGGWNAVGLVWRVGPSCVPFLLAVGEAELIRRMLEEFITAVPGLRRACAKLQSDLAG